MKKILLLAGLVVSICAAAQVEKVIPKRPDPPRLVNDFTNTLTSEQRDALESKLVKYDDSTSNQIAVVIINTTQDYPIEDVALGILRNWGVGNEQKNNGIVLLVAKEDHNIRIEVGYGLEGAVPDITANQIIQSDIVPNFKQGNFYQGLDIATGDIIKAAAGEYKAPPGYANRGKKGINPGIIVLILVIIWILIRISSRGGGGGGMMSRRGFSGWWAPVWPGGGWIGGGGGGGGGWSGGGGGFGGFGGGGGGGGGASGSW
jgi:uncharacterized protein